MTRLVVLANVAGLLLAATTAEAQRVRGHAFEDGTRTPIVGAFVELTTVSGERVATAQTDSLGAFQLRANRSGSFHIRSSHLAYARVDSVALEIGPGETVEVELRMAARAIPLEPLVVTSRGDPRLQGFRERSRRPGFGRFVTRDDIADRPGARATELLRGMPGVYLSPTPTAGPGNIITMRGGATGRCMPTIYIDGMPTHQFSDATIDAFLLPEMLEGVEVYHGTTAPGTLFSRDGCGTIAFWTRSDAGRPFSWRRIFTAAGFVSVAVFLSSLLMR